MVKNGYCMYDMTVKYKAVHKKAQNVFDYASAMLWCLFEQMSNNTKCKEKQVNRFRFSMNDEL